MREEIYVTKLNLGIIPDRRWQLPTIVDHARRPRLPGHLCGNQPVLALSDGEEPDTGQNAALVLDRFHNVHAVRHGPKNHMFAIQPVVHVQIDKKLRRVRVPSSIRHR